MMRWKVKGLTLVEVVVAVGFLSLALIPLFGIVNGSLGKGSDALAEVIATAHGETALEYLRSIDTRTIGCGKWHISPDEPDLPEFLQPLATLLSLDTPPDMTIEISDSTEGMVKITVSVVFGRDNAARLSTVIIKRNREA
ncbi:MAG: hypothetical protein CVV64_08545 [Candidatus Wallbacteria bacterium HGW-Wallbacteria-1]|uniref:Uncharacterized protein n=1 Tax=Candidatus Wallbacteria bacterium HGW-Wallbacteria-1 TaxID=2013854 RepID=A0A2N1PPY1_9BACT|nr:MAG: hypothetical protein CVV64_08545 [Candidatus Wallbacteria bacterium HGW-Wallbacteria-1]